MEKPSGEMKSCIDACQSCYATCLQTAMQHCLQLGGPHTEPKHFQLVMACAETCRTSAALMLIGSPSHLMQCDLCAKICEECATDCERIGDMEECVQACRLCQGMPADGQPRHGGLVVRRSAKMG